MIYVPSYRPQNMTPFDTGIIAVPDGCNSKLLYSENNDRYLGVESEIGKG